MAETPNYNFPYPGGTTAPNGPYAFQQLAEAIDTELKARADRRTKHYPPGRSGGEVLLGGDGAWTDIATVTATVRGQLCTADFKASFYNDNSGTQKTTVWRLGVGTAAQWTGGTASILWTGQGDAPYRAGDRPRVSIAMAQDTTPAAGARVFKLQAYASLNNSVKVSDAVLTVTEWEA